MLEKLLQCPNHHQHLYYKYLPVSTSYQRELEVTAGKILEESLKLSVKQSNHVFLSNEDIENIQSELVLLKLKGYVDQKDITGKSTQIRKLPKNIQVGTIVEGDAIQSAGIRMKKKQLNFLDYYLKIDQEKSFTKRKFSELQKLNQRKKKLKRKIINKKIKKQKPMK